MSAVRMPIGTRSILGSGPAAFLVTHLLPIHQTPSVQRANLAKHTKELIKRIQEALIVFTLHLVMASVLTAWRPDARDVSSPPTVCRQPEDTDTVPSGSITILVLCMSQCMKQRKQKNSSAQNLNLKNLPQDMASKYRVFGQITVSIPPKCFKMHVSSSNNN